MLSPVVSHSVTYFNTGHNLDLLCFTVFLMMMFIINKMVVLPYFNKFFSHELLNFCLKRWGMQITTVTVVGSGQERSPRSPKRNIDETQAPCQNSELVQDLFTDTPTFTTSYVIFKWVIWDTFLMKYPFDYLRKVKT